MSDETKAAEQEDVEGLKSEQELEDLRTELDAVMVSVDKWLLCPEEEGSPANRAAVAREAALGAIEDAHAEIERLRGARLLDEDCTEGGRCDICREPGGAGSFTWVIKRQKLCADCLAALTPEREGDGDE